MTREQITELCQRAGFPAPIFDKAFATIRVPIGEALDMSLADLAKVPKVTPERFDRWCGKASHAGVARFVNHQLGTRYGLQDIYNMRRGAKHISARIKTLVRDHPRPIDPKI